MTGPIRRLAARAAAALRAAAVAAVVLAGVVLASSTARADDNKVKAVALFDEGIKEMKAGNYEKACKALEASNRLLSDSGTRGSLARCYTQLGKIASAWVLWRELSDTAPTDDLRDDAAAQAKKLQPRLAKYAVKITSPVPGLTVTVAGQPTDATIELPVPIDPGAYPVEATAPGRVPWKGRLTAVEGKTVEVVVPELEADASGPPPERPVTAGSPGRGRRILGLVIVGAGVGGLAVGGVFGAKASSLNDEAIQICGGNIGRCDQTRTNEAQAKVDDARAAANLSTIGFIAGGAAVAAGVILYVTAPKAEQRAVAVSPLIDATTAGFAISGRY